MDPIFIPLKMGPTGLPETSVLKTTCRVITQRKEGFRSTAAEAYHRIWFLSGTPRLRCATCCGEIREIQVKVDPGLP